LVLLPESHDHYMAVIPHKTTASTQIPSANSPGDVYHHIVALQPSTTIAASALSMMTDHSERDVPTLSTKWIL
jgi:hypothetical protein